jgi:hypothetical protein
MKRLWVTSPLHWWGLTLGFIILQSKEYILCGFANTLFLRIIWYIPGLLKCDFEPPSCIFWIHSYSVSWALFRYPPNTYDLELIMIIYCDSIRIFDRKVLWIDMYRTSAASFVWIIINNVRIIIFLTRMIFWYRCMRRPRT